MAETIMVVDDQSSVRQLLQEYLTEQGYRVVTAADGQTALYLARHEQPDLVLLDVMMPKMDGYQFLRQFRLERNIPIIIITAREDETDAVLGLDLGADDYVVKPFRMRELVARIRALLRRAGPVGTKGLLSWRDIAMDQDAHRVTRAGRAVPLGPTEYRLLEFMLQHPGRVFSREQLLDAVWGRDIHVEIRTVDVHIRRLRAALESSGHHERVETVRGTGYRFRGA
jgi:two-component system phosphate regulon response regulator PhoB